jgi:1,4-dihydroxy-2-naphthoyl-CoA hydrolase
MKSSAMIVSGRIEFTITKHSPDEVIGEMPVQPGILNPFGVVHAGATLWFADVCATVLAFGVTDFVADAAGFPLAVNLNAALLGNQKDGVFKAAGFVKRGRESSVVQTTVTGEGGRLIADVTSSHFV